MKKSSKSLMAAIVSVVLVLCMSLVVVFTAFASNAPAADANAAEITTEKETEPEETTTEPASEPEETTTEIVEPTEPSTAEQPLEWVVGDVNKDGEINTSDARLALRISVNLENADNLTLFLADVNGDKAVMTGDARQILRYAVKLSVADDCKIGAQVYQSAVDEGGLTAINEEGITVA